MRRDLRFAVAGALIAFFGLAGPFAWKSWTRALGPLDLAALADSAGSPIAVDRDGKLLRAFTTADGRWRLPVRSADIDPRFIAMLIAYEDRHFYAHHGIDAGAVLRATMQTIRHAQVRSGASTLTMQLARLLEPRPERTIAAKLHQAWRARQIEATLTKTQILDAYFALAPYGGNIEGVRAASLTWFGKEPARLSNAEAALLVALPQSPETRRPDRDAQTARRARDRVLTRAARAGIITDAEARAARLDDVPRERKAFPALAPHASEAALRDDAPMRVHRLTLDRRLQTSLENLAREAAERLGPKLSLAILAIDNATGEIRVHVGSPDYFSDARAGAIDMTGALRSPGSTLKPFIYALAFENGIAHPETLVDDRQARYGAYAPENFDLSFQGVVTARRALQFSLNAPAVELLDLVGPSRFLARLRNAGATVIVPGEAPPGLAIGLGGVGIKLADLARLYAGLARGGSVPPWRERPEAVRAPPPDARLIAEPVAAWYVADILRGAPPPQNGVPGRIAYKTGTSYGYRDAFAVGFDRKTTVAVWVGRPDNGAVPGLVGRKVAAPILFDAFARIGGDNEPFVMPHDALLARTGDLPPPLRHLRRDAPKTLAAAATPALKIAFPPDGARVDLGFARHDAASALALKAQGGSPPLTWMVNGAPVGEPDLRRQSQWAPDGAGFVRVSVIDAKGATDSVTVRLE